MIISNLNLTQNEENHYIMSSRDGKIFSKENYKKYNIKNIEIDIFDDIQVSFEMNNDDYHDLIMYNDTPKKRDNKYYEKIPYSPEFKSIIIKCSFNDYEIELIDYIGREIFYEMGKIKSPKLSGICSYCKLIKNNEEINYAEKVKIWDAYNTDFKISNYFCLDFKNEHLKKSILISKNNNCKLDENIKINLEKVFEEINPNNWFIYQKQKYEDYLKNHNEFIENIDLLLSFFTSTINHHRMRVIETIDSKKLIIIFKSKNMYKLNGYTIFSPQPNTFMNFIDSSYEKIIELKESNFNIELLIQYYIWFKNEYYLDMRHLMGSIFLETLIKQYYKNEKKKFAKKLKKILEHELNFNISKIFDEFEKGLLSDLEKIKISKMNELNNDKNINIVLKRFKEFLFIEILTKYRNKNVHSGEIKLNNYDLNEILENSLIKTSKDLNGKKNEEVIKILYENKDQLMKSEYLNNLDTQNIVLENLIEIILLKLLDTNCGLLPNKLRKNVNSKEYLKSLSKK